MNAKQPGRRRKKSKEEKKEEDQLVREVAERLHKELKEQLEWGFSPGRLRAMTNYSEEEFVWIGRALWDLKPEMRQVNWDWAKHRVKARLVKCANTYAISQTFMDEFYDDIGEIFPNYVVHNAIRMLVATQGEYMASYFSGAIEAGLQEWHKGQGFKYLTATVPVTLRLPPESQAQMGSDVIKKVIENLTEETKRRGES